MHLSVIPLGGHYSQNAGGQQFRYAPLGAQSIAVAIQDSSWASQAPVSPGSALQWECIPNIVCETRMFDPLHYCRAGGHVCS